MDKSKLAKKRAARKSPDRIEAELLVRHEASIYGRMLPQLSVVETVVYALDADGDREVHLCNALSLASKALHQLAGEVEVLEAKAVRS